MYIQKLNSEIFSVLNVAYVSYRDSVFKFRTHLLYNYLFPPPSNIFYESIDYSQFIFSIFQIDFS